MRSLRDQGRYGSWKLRTTTPAGRFELSLHEGGRLRAGASPSATQQAAAPVLDQPGSGFTFASARLALSCQLLVRSLLRVSAVGVPSAAAGQQLQAVAIRDGHQAPPAGSQKQTCFTATVCQEHPSLHRLCRDARWQSRPFGPMRSTASHLQGVNHLLQSCFQQQHLP